MLADSTGIAVVGPGTEEPVLLGAAMLGACAASFYSDLATSMDAMSSVAKRYAPADSSKGEKHGQRFALFVRFQELAQQAADM